MKLVHMLPGEWYLQSAKLVVNKYEPFSTSAKGLAWAKKQSIAVTQVVERFTDLTTAKSRYSGRLPRTRLSYFGQCFAEQEAISRGAQDGLQRLISAGLYSPTRALTLVQVVALDANGREDRELLVRYKNDPEQLAALNDAVRGHRHIVLQDHYALSEEGVRVHYVLNLAECFIGLARLAIDHPQLYSRWLMNMTDGVVGDAFLQCAVFGGVVYG